MDVIPDKRYAEGVVPRPVSSAKGSITTAQADTPPPDTTVNHGNAIQNEYTMLIGKRPKLYDLNKNYTNFEIEFQIDAERPDLRFHVHILPQDQLDKTDLEDIPMKAVQGKISGKVSNNNNVYQNYFIILKNDTDEEAKVLIRTRTLVFPITVPESTTPVHPSADPTTPTELPTEHYTSTTESSTNAPSTFFRNPYVVYIIAGLVICGIIGFFIYKYSGKSTPVQALQPVQSVQSVQSGYPVHETVKERVPLTTTEPFYENQPVFTEKPASPPLSPKSYDDSASEDGSESLRRDLLNFTKPMR
jgi:hypothetical protein